MNDNLYTWGFNNGYLLARERPGLLEDILKGPNKQDEFIAGMVAGKHEYEMEMGKERMEELRNLRDQNIDKSLDP